MRQSATWFPFSRHSVLYRVLRQLARIALRWYYRSIQVTGKERIPATGPLILVANHNNALVDALLVGTTVDRVVRLTAKATLLDNPIVRLLISSVGVVPLRRRADEKEVLDPALAASRNEEAFREVIATLGSGRAVLIFPEGISHSASQLAPLKTGSARIVLQAYSAGVRGIRVVPIGLIFEDKARPRSDVLVQVGRAIDADAYITPDSAAAVKELTQGIEAGLRGVTLNFPTDSEAFRVLELSRTLGQVLDRLRELHEGETPLLESVRIARRLEEVRLTLPSLDEPTALRVERFIARLQTFAHSVSELRLPLNDVWMPVTAASGAWFIVRECVIGLIVAPVALWGRLNHWIPLRAAMELARRTSRHADQPAMRTIVSGLLFVLVTYTITAVVIALLVGWKWGLVYLASLPLSASVDFWFADRLDRAIRRARGYLRFKREPTLQTRLVEEAAWLRREAESLDQLLG